VKEEEEEEELQKKAHERSFLKNVVCLL